MLPLRVSKAVSAEKLEAVLAFYGIGNGSQIHAHAAGLGFRSQVLADEHDHTGVRSVTVMLSPDAKTHLQFWVRPEEASTSGPALPTVQAFQEAASNTQMEVPGSASQGGYCKAGIWTVSRYIAYQLQVHESVMTPPPPDPSTKTPPVGYAQDLFIDDHISWDCTAPDCNVANGSEALYRSGSRIQWMDASSRGFPGWGPYGYDPAGYAIQLHWANTPADFKPHGKLYPICFDAETDGTCQGSSTLMEPATATKLSKPSLQNSPLIITT